jgi:fatty acid synthase
MGSQWVGMGKELMKLHVFKNAIEKCHAALTPYSIDLLSVLTSEDPTLFDNILNSFIGIAAVQVKLISFFSFLL